MLKKIIAVIMASILILQMPVTASAAEPEISSVAAILMEAKSGKVIYEKNADQLLQPASITKIMTLLLIFEKLESGSITLDEKITVSEHAAGMGGSQVFLEPGETQTVDTMIKCISVASANDASVAMAERIAGTEEAFVEMMNQKAKELGMNSTHFVNCCGLDNDDHVMSARDVAIVSRELITKYPQIHDYSTIWMDTITHVTRRGESEFQLSNTNKLIKQYEWATGLKTGSTSKAKCCLSATAKKNNIELIAVVMAAPNSKTRFSDAITLLNYGYNTCSIYQDNEEKQLEPVNVVGGKQGFVPVKCESDFTYLFLENYDKNLITSEIVMEESLKAPFDANTKAGEIIYYYQGEEIGRVNILTQEGVEEEGIFDAFGKVFGNWLI